MANQFVQQLVTDNDTTMRDALFGNVGSFFSFQVGPSDAEFVALQLGVDEEDLLNLPKFHTYAKVLVDGETRGPILCRTQCPY